MADLIIDIGAISGKSSFLSDYSNKASTIYDTFKSGAIGKAKSPISGLSGIVDKPLTRYKNGFSNSSEWLTSYVSGIESLESSLASFKGQSVTTPIAFNGKFEDLFGRVTMPVLKTNGDKMANYKTYGVVSSTESTTEVDATTTASQAGLTIDTANGSTIQIPDSVKQRGYTVTCYGVGGWHYGGEAKASKIGGGTRQEKVHQKWVADGARYKNGIAVMNINGVDHYLVAVSPTFGYSGSVLSVKLKNGETLPCVVADSKSTGDGNYTKYGHSSSSKNPNKGAINVLEFEVDRTWYKSKGNPGSDKWPTSWDSSSKVSSITTYGSVI